MPDKEEQPDWMPSLMLGVICPHIVGQDPIHCQVWRHDDGQAWHINVEPTLFEENGESFLRGYHIHLSAILVSLTNVDIVVDSDTLSIQAKFEEHPIHILICLQPNDEDDEESDEEDAAPEGKLPTELN
jgi:hypothetical protein